MSLKMLILVTFMSLLTSNEYLVDLKIHFYLS
jgi:hypothetical protein